MRPVRDLGIGSWWADDFAYVAAVIPHPGSAYVVRAGYIFRARDGWVVR